MLLPQTVLDIMYELDSHPCRWCSFSNNTFLRITPGISYGNAQSDTIFILRYPRELTIIGVSRLLTTDLPEVILQLNNHIPIPLKYKLHRCCRQYNGIKYKSSLEQGNASKCAVFARKGKQRNAALWMVPLYRKFSPLVMDHRLELQAGTVYIQEPEVKLDYRIGCLYPVFLPGDWIWRST